MLRPRRIGDVKGRPEPEQRTTARNIVAILALALICIGCMRSPQASLATPSASANGSPSGSPTPASTGTPAAGAISHVVVVWLENHEASSVTSATMPYLTGLAAKYGNATNYDAVAHPSLPNYLAFWSGSTQGIDDDKTYNLAGPSLSSQLTTARISWRVYAQNYPNNGRCNTGASYIGPADGWGVAGTYARKHNPAMSFTSVSGNRAECLKIRPLAQFDPKISVSFVVPNLCNDAHDCPLAKADAFLKAFSPTVFRSPEWANTLYVVTFDEGKTTEGGGGRIFAMVARKGLSHFTSSAPHNHYGLTRTIEDIFGLRCLNRACQAKPMTEFLP